MNHLNLKKRAMQLAAVLLSLAVLLPSVPAAFASQSAAEGTAVVFSESGITAADESGLSIDGTTLTIEQAGTYVLSGTCSDGSVKVKKGVTGVTLVLSGLDLTSSTTAPITCGKSSGVTILAAEGTENALTDAAANNGDNYPDNADAENAVIKCKDGSQVTIGGTGTLTVTANGKNGIKSGATTDEEGTAWLVIEDLTLTINAPVNDAVNAEASLTVKSGTITIDAGDDALHADYALAIGESGTSGPTITINSCYEGLAGANLLVASGAITIYSEDDCLNAANSDLTGYDFTMGITGGTIRAYAASDDGLDSNGSLTISGGTLTVWTANTADNQALDADGTITVSGGTVFAAGGSAGMGMTLSASQPYICRNYSLQTLCGAPHNVCNDNGIAENLPLNRMLGDYDIIHGTFFVCGLTRDDFTDLTPQQMKHYEEMYHDPQLFFLLGKTLCVEHTTPEEYARVMTPPPNTKESHER